MKAWISSDFMGSASAAYQIEGAGRKCKGVTNWRIGTYSRKDIALVMQHVAVDHYHRCKEDIALMAEMGLKISNAPSPGQESTREGKGKLMRKALSYQNIIDECLKYRSNPMVTIYRDPSQALVDAFTV